MQALHTSPPQDTRSPYEDQFNYLRIAIWMIEFRNRYPIAGLTPGRYRKVLNKLYKAQENAEAAHNQNKQWSVHGGTALRLAKAIWSFEYRLLYPNNLQLKLKEERDTGHLYHHHRPKKSRGKYHVAMAMEDFFNLRTSVPNLESIPTLAAPKEDVFKPNPFTKALRKLDTFVSNHRRLRNRLVFQDILPVIAKADPAHKALLTPFCEAALAWAHWLDNPQDIVNGRNRTLAYEALLAAQYANREYLQSEAGRNLNKAIDQMLYEMRLPLS